MKEACDLMKEKIMQDRRIGRSSLEAFLEILKEVECKCSECSKRSWYQKGYEDAKAEYGNGWIPCNRADHPYDGQRVLACINTRIATHEIIITDYNGEIYWFDGTISAWMPLPELYQPTTD